MGLDVNFRLRRKSAKPTCIDDYDEAQYSDDDIKDVEQWFNGRIEFDCIRRWVGDYRYGKYIPLSTSNYKSLKNVIEEELFSRASRFKQDYRKGTAEYDYELNDIFTTIINHESSCCRLEALYTFISIAPIVLNYDWYLEIECDW